MDTIINIYKPPGMRSFEVVEFLRRILKERKVGYAGILDAPAEGVMIVGVGKATKLLDFFLELPKEYEAEVLLGVKTDTGDTSGNIIERAPVSNIKKEDIEAATKQFIGEITQIPPMFSAQKVNGKPLHKIARKGITVERKPKKVTIHEIELKSVKETPEGLTFTISVKCSRGTYIRVLAEDIAQRLGTVGTVNHLKRTAVGPFRIEDALPLNEVNTSSILPLASSIEPLLGIVVTKEELSKIRRYGYTPNRWNTYNKYVRVINEDGRLKGLGKLDKEKLMISKWWISQG